VDWTGLDRSVGSGGVDSHKGSAREGRLIRIVAGQLAMDQTGGRNCG
jgi:hypothetical protein